MDEDYGRKTGCLIGMELAKLQGLLLDMLSTERPIDASTIDGMDAEDWERLMAMARQHRLLPLLHWRLSRERAGLPVPENIRESLAADFKRSGMRVLKMQRELLLIHRLFDDAGIPHLALKGAYLAFYAYPQPALRPMRDLDILVPEQMALKAYTILSENGFMRPKRFQGDLDASMKSWKHLPPLFSVSGRVGVDLHTRFSDPADWDDRPDLVEDDGLWQRVISHTVAGEQISYLSPIDQILHLIEHSIYNHRLDNGPLALCDLAFLLEAHSIDWALFWQRAEFHGLVRGALLLLKMVERYFGSLSVEWPADDKPGAVVTDDMVETASLLSLRDWASKEDVKLQIDVHSQGSFGRKFGVFVGKLFPTKRAVAARYPVSEHSPRIYLWYLVRWWHMLIVRLPSYLSSRRNERSMDEAKRVLLLDQWLQNSVGE